VTKKPRLTLFDLDHTLLSGDTDVLWCEFLMDKGVLERRDFAARNADMEARYKAGTVGVQEFADFYVGTLVGKSMAEWEPLRRAFLASHVIPRIPRAAIHLVRQHLRAGELVVMTTATNRFITELTAVYFGIENLLATETEVIDGVFSGKTSGTLNMRAGKVERLGQWLAARGNKLEDFHSTAYSDSINDRPLLEAVDEAVAVDPDPLLSDVAHQRGWRVLRLHPADARS
jgi:HAD superfamily hydrolase (TIGR01490 family)